MPKIWDKCVEDIKLKIKEGKMPKTYIDKITGKRLKSNPYKICSKLMKGGKKKNVK